MTRRASRFAIVLLLSAAVARADFPQFRGPNGNGTATGVRPPLKWSGDADLAWATQLPGSGWSQPVVVGNTVFLTAAVADDLPRPKDMKDGVKDMRSIPGMFGKAPDIAIDWQLLAVGADSGSVRWAKSVAKGKPKYPIHPSNTYATETPCADAERVYALFGATGTLAAFDHGGRELWKVELGAFPFSSGFGSGSSPALHDGRLFVASINQKEPFVVAVDAKTGRELWRQSPGIPGSAWASPLVWVNSRRAEVVICGNMLVTSYDPATGRELWRLGGLDTSFAPSPACEGDRLVFGASSPFSKSPMYAVKAGADGDITLKAGEKSGPFVEWSRTGGNIGMSSPVAAGGLAYFPSDGFLTCYDAATGNQIYKERLPRARMVTASPVLVGDKLLLLDETGKAAWVKTGPKFEVVGGGELPDTFWSSPAVAGDRLFLRGVDKLYCVRHRE